MRQGNDVGTSYRSIIIVADDEQRAAAEASKAMYQEQLSAKGYGAITTEIVDAAPTRSTTPRTTTSSTSTRTRAATARTTRPA